MKKQLFCTLSFLFLSCFNFMYAQVWEEYADSARIFSDKEQFKSSILYYSKALDLLKNDSAGTLTYARISNSLGAVYYYTGNLERAEQDFLISKAIREKILGIQHPDYLTLCNNLASLYKEMGLYDKAEPLYLQTLQTREKILGKMHISYAESCNNLGSFYFQLGQLEKAEPLFLQTKNILEQKVGKQNVNYASTCTNLGVVYHELGRYDKSEAFLLEAKNISEKLKGKQSINYATICNDLAGLYVDIGQYQKAESLYVEAKEIREKVLGKEHPDYAQNCDNLAALYDIIGNQKKAEPLYLEAKDIREKVLGKENPEYTTSCNNLGLFYYGLQQFDKAEKLLLEGKEIEEKIFGKSNSEYATTCHNLAIVYEDLNKYDKAEELYIESKNIREKILGNQHSLYSSSCVALANLYWNINRYDKASQLFNEAFQINSNQLKSIFDFTNELEKFQFIDNIAGKGAIFHSFYYSNKNQLKDNLSFNVSLFNRGLILSSNQQLKKAIFNSGALSTGKTYQEWTELKKELSFWYSKPKEQQTSKLKELETKASEMEKQLTKISSQFKDEQDKKNIKWIDIQQSLRENETVVEFVEFNYYTGRRWTDSTFYIAQVLKKNMTSPELVFLFEKKELVSLLSNTGNNKNENIKKLYTRGAGEDINNNATGSVYQLVWKPLEKYLTGTDKIYFAPAGLLHRISFAALPINSKEVLSDKYRLVQLNTTASVVDRSLNTINVTDKIALYGGINYTADPGVLKKSIANYTIAKGNMRSVPDDITRGNSWQELPGTQVEIDGINKESSLKYSVSVLSGSNATEESIKALDGKNSPAVLHIATHGFFFADPKDKKRDRVEKDFELSGRAFKQADDPLLRSGLLFAGANNAWQNKPVEGMEDGILTSYEVSNLYLPNTKLVVLSACETALGDIQGSEGVYGLQRAFKMAGAQNLMMSLWKVPDNETAEFMQVFYKNIFIKQSISDAFFNAQSLMKNKYRNDPYKWAAWILVR